MLSWTPVDLWDLRMMFGGSFFGLGATAGGLLGSISTRGTAVERLEGVDDGSEISRVSGLPPVGSIGIGLTDTVGTSMELGGVGLMEISGAGLGLVEVGSTLAGLAELGFADPLKPLTAIFFSETLLLSTSRLIVGLRAGADVAEEFSPSL